MADKVFNTRLINKHDTEANWLKATGFIPKQGEIIVYDIDDNYTYERFKIGDGVSNVNDLPFTMQAITNAEIDAICGNLEFNDTLTDEITGTSYKLYVSDGNLKMTEVK